jgi:hypothetical protein
MPESDQEMAQKGALTDRLEPGGVSTRQGTIRLG